MSRWPELKRIIITADCTREAFSPGIEPAIRQAYPSLTIDFFFYTPEQAALTSKLELPFVYSWLSWCIALAETRTEHVLIQDYDALVMGSTLESRYREFVRSGSKIQGISWYKSNGIEEAQHLATTFEAFVDVTWLRSFKPIMLFNKLRVIEGRSIDMDTTLDIQQKYLRVDERTVSPMNLDELVHPSQMVHQYTMFRHSPGAALPTFSIPMIPFFAYLGGNTAALERATKQMESSPIDNVDFLSDGTRFNFSKLTLANVDWALKQIVQAALALEVSSGHHILQYGTALYKMIGAEKADYWRGDFTPSQRDWINQLQPAPTQKP